jgi:hypothetical protein
VSYRGSAPRSGATPTERALKMLADGLDQLSRRVSRIESSNRRLPPGIVLTVEEDSQGTWVVIEHLHTGKSQRIAGPL